MRGGGFIIGDQLLLILTRYVFDRCTGAIAISGKE